MSKVKEGIFVFGASGHAKVVIDIIERQDCFAIQYVVDDDPWLKETIFFSYPVIGGKAELLSQNGVSKQAIVAIGDNRARGLVAAWLELHGYQLVNVIHPSVQVARGVIFGKGNVVMANAVINSDTAIGGNVIVNSGATIDHDCVIGDGVHVAPGCTLCGAVKVGNNSFIGAGSTVIQNICIGENVFIGAGATIYRDIPAGSKVIGSKLVGLN